MDQDQPLPDGLQVVVLDWVMLVPQEMVVHITELLLFLVDHMLAVPSQRRGQLVEMGLHLLVVVAVLEILLATVVARVVLES